MTKPSIIIYELLVDVLALLSDPTLDTDWPLYIDHEPHSPDECFTIYDTVGINEQRDMSTGLVVVHHGIQIRARGRDYKATWAKLYAVVLGLDGVQAQEVTSNSVDYIVHALTKTTAISSLGKEVGNTKRRNLFTVNYTVTLDTN